MIVRTWFTVEDPKAGKPLAVRDLEIENMPGLFELVEVGGEKYKVTVRMWDIGREGNVPHARCYMKVVRHDTGTEAAAGA